MSGLFVSTAGGVLALCLFAQAWWRGRFGRAARALSAFGARTPVPDRPARSRGRPLTRLPFPFGYLNRRMREGTVAVGLQTVVLVAVSAAVVLWAAATLVLGPGWPADLAILGGFWAPVAWVDRQASRRRELIAEEMERAAAALEAAFAAGMVPYEALLEVGLGAGGILGREFLRVVADADRVGISIALAMFAERLPLPEVQLLTAALRLNQGAGAGLAGALAGLHRTLRDRRETAAAMRSATASGRWQAGMLVAVPPLLLLFLRVVYPAFEAPLFGSAGGKALLVGGSGWLLVGYVVVRRMCVPREMV